MLSELGAQLQLEEVHTNSNGNRNKLGFEEKEEKTIFSFLELQRDGLEQLMKNVKKNMRDLQIIQNRLTPHLNK